MVKKILFGLLICLMASPIYAQLNHPIKFKTSVFKDSIIIDSLSIIPNSVKIFLKDKEIKNTDFKVDYANSILTWLTKPTITDTFRIYYQVFPISLKAKYKHKDVALIGAKTVSDYQPIYTIKQDDNTLFKFGTIDKSGSISRSVAFGNNQNLSVNSNMVIQLAGKISNDVEILAAISDENIPLQPEGNTQQLNDFDKVFIQLQRKNTKFIAGDYELKKPESYFMNYYKRTQGAYLSNQTTTKNNQIISTQIAGAVAKGRSSRNTFIGQEGNQGPYRLIGNNSEQFIIILSGTDRVYIDGQLMIRGQDNDYIIDYNTSELTFTTKRLITQNSRISVEFEYSDKQYARSLIYANQGFEGKKLKFAFNLYNEQDNPNLPFLQNLTDNQKDYLKTIGNNINKAFTTNAQEVAFNRNEVLYKLMDTLNSVNVYVYSTDSLLAKYRVGFSFVGAGKGNYKIKDNATANGRVYEFVPPINTIPQGDYEPITLLITPKKQQLFTFNTQYNLTKNTQVFAETGFSNQDVNLFSAQDNNVNKGFAYKINVENRRLLSGTDSSGIKLISLFSYENLNQFFKPLERFRPVEFDRDFNISKTNLNVAEKWLSGQIQLLKSGQKQITYKLSNFNQKNNYVGWLHAFKGNYAYKDLTIFYNGSFLNSNTSIENGKFIRQYFNIKKNIANIQTFFNAEQEYNETLQANHTLSPLSFAYKQFEIVLRSNSSAKNIYQLSYIKRYDKLPNVSELKEFSEANTFNIKADINKNPLSKLSFNTTFRKVDYINNDSLKKDEKTLVGRLDYNLKALKGFVNYNMFYELGTGQEPKREFTYLEVLAGQGIYAWNDYNKNGVKELNEFEISRFSDQAKYIRIFRSTNQFIKSNFTSINQTLQLNGSNLFKNKTATFSKIFSKISNLSSLRIDQKSVSENEALNFNPYQNLKADNNLLSNNLFFRSSLFYDKANPVFGIDVNHQQNASRILLTNGFDDRIRQDNSLRLRWNFIQKSNFILELKQGDKDYKSQLFSLNNYEINFIEFSPEFSYQFNTNLKTIISTKWTKQKNGKFYGGEETLNAKFSAEVKYNLLKKGILGIQINGIKNKFEGLSNSPVGYEMLEGLQPGLNTTWNFTFQRTISNGIQLNLTYEGRKSESVNTIHTGGMQVRAYF